MNARVCLLDPVPPTTMSLILLPIIETYRAVLTPIAPFTWFGLPFTTLDVLAATRLCVALRQFKEKLRDDHINKLNTLRAQGKAVDPQEEIEERSFVRDAAAALTVVYGGELVTGKYTVHDRISLSFSRGSSAAQTVRL